LGDWDTQHEDELRPMVDVAVHHIVMHPHYWDPALWNDVALLFLDGAVNRDYHVNTVCLPQQGQDLSRSQGCIANGWGKEEFNSATSQNIMKLVPLEIIPRSTCQERLRRSRLGGRFELHQSVICAQGDKGVDTCTGDGGGPLTCEVNGQYYLAGIISWGIGCGQYPGGYADVSKVSQWIQNEIRQNPISRG